MLKYIIILLIITSLVLYGNSAVAHKHEKYSSKERLKDGVFSPRDEHHNENGKHNVEFDHEAILGSVKEAEEFDSLTPEESKKRLAKLVKKMDLNSDEFVDRHELKAWILRSFKKLSEEEANDRFEDIDENNDSQIKWGEYLVEVYGGNENETIPDSEEAKLVEDDRIMFNAADLNKDGLLNLEEFVLFQNPEEDPRMLPIILQQTLRDKDIDNDNKISFTEFIGDSGKTKGKEWLVTEKAKFDEEFDKNKDNYLTGNEILAWIVPSNDDIATEEVNHLFITTDENHDDRLSSNEIIENYVTFVGSEATDYGEHLQNLEHDEF